VAPGGAPLEVAVGEGVVDASGAMTDAVVVTTQGSQVGDDGGAALGARDSVVEVTADRRHPAPREHTGRIPSLYEALLRQGGPSSGDAGDEDPAGVGIGGGEAPLRSSSSNMCSRRYQPPRRFPDLGLWSAGPESATAGGDPEGGGAMGWNAAIVFAYGVPVPGREAAALENFANAQTFFGKLATDGRCAEPEFFHRGYGGGMMIIKGETPEILHEILDMEEARKLISTATFTSGGFSFEMYATGEVMMDRMSMYAGVGTELGYL
jgi:hypothetical protein